MKIVDMYSGVPSSASTFSSVSVSKLLLRTMVGSLLLLLMDSAMISVVSVDDKDLVSPLGPFRFFLGNTALMTF